MVLLDFIKTLVPHLSKNDVLEDIRITKNELVSTTIPSLEQGAAHFNTTKMNSDDNKALSLLFFRNYDLAGSKSSSSIIAEINSKIGNMLKNLEFIEKEFDAVVGADIITDGITVKKAILLRGIEQISFISRFTLDFLTVLYMNEAIHADVELEESLKVPTIVIDRVNKNLAMYARLLTIYANKDFIFEKRLANLPDVVLNEATAESVASVYNQDKLDPLNAPVLPGFGFNPIYHLRLIITEWQVSRYNVMKDKKKMLELRLMQLKLLTDKKSDPKLEQEITYIQSRIDKIEYSMSKMESD